MEYAQKARQSQKTADAEAAEAVTDQRDSQLDEDVSCCIADIDAMLDEVDETELLLAERKRQDQEQAEKDFWANYSRRGQAWQQKYAHLGAYTRECCGTEHPRFRD